MPCWRRAGFPVDGARRTAARPRRRTRRRSRRGARTAFGGWRTIRVASSPVICSSPGRDSSTHGRDHAPLALERGAVAMLCDETPEPGALAELDGTLADHGRAAPLCWRLSGRGSTATRIGNWDWWGSPAPTARRPSSRWSPRSSRPPGGRPARSARSGYRFRERDLGFDRTTPEASDLFRILRLLARRRSERGGDGGLLARPGAGSRGRTSSSPSRCSPT